MKGVQMTVTWLSPEKAAYVLGVSYSTLQRRIKKGTLEVRCTSDGRQEVLVDEPKSDDSQMTSSDQMQLAAVNTALASKLSDQTAQEVERFERVYKRVEHDLVRSRRIGATGWVLVFILLAGGIGAAWKGARILAQGEAQAQNAAQRAETLQADLSIARTEKDAVRVSLATINEALREQTVATREKSAEIKTLRVELPQARKMAGRPTWIRQVLSAFHTAAGQPTTRPTGGQE